MSCTSLIRGTEGSFNLARKIVDALSTKFQFDASEGWNEVCSAPIEKVERKFRRERLHKKKLRNVKGPHSSYLIYSMDVRPTVIKQNPKASLTETSKIIANQWHQLSTSEREKYTKLAQKDRERYNTELAVAKAKEAAQEAANPTQTTPVEVVIQETTQKAKKPRAAKPASAKPASAKPASVKPASVKPATTTDAAAVKETATPAPTKKVAKSATKGSFKTYQTAKRADFEKKNPTAKKAELTKIMSEAWAGLSDKQQGKFVVA
jgi:hypothetical protein